MSIESSDDFFDDDSGESDRSEEADEKSSLKSQEESKSDSENENEKKGSSDASKDSASEKSDKSVSEEELEEEIEEEEEPDESRKDDDSDKEGGDDNGAGSSDDEDGRVHFENDNASEELEIMSNLSSNKNMRPLSSHTKPPRHRPSSARNPVKVLISSSTYNTRPHSQGDPRGRRRSSNGGSSGGSGDGVSVASLLVVRKSPVHDRPPSGQRSHPSTPPHSPSPVMSTSTRGVNRFITTKEHRSTKGSGTSMTRPRPKSAVQPKIIDRTSPMDRHPRQRPLGDYTRSLKMLGVKVPSPTPKRPRSPRSSSSQSWQSNGKLHTRVTRRSTSLEDVRRAIPQVNTPQTLQTLRVDEGQRATLSQAIYEEWYFNRCKQIRAKRAKQKAQIREEEARKERLNREKEVKVKTAVEEWEEQKINKRKQELERKKQEKLKKMDEEKEKDEKQMRVTAAVVAWETEKIELAKKKKEIRRLLLEEKKDKEQAKLIKKQESQLIFNSWKHHKRIDEKEKRKVQKEVEEEKCKKEQRDLQEKKEIGQMAFGAWKRKKLMEESANMRNVIMASETSKTIELKRRLHRSSEALKAYEDWLDDVETRQPIRLYENARSSVLSQVRPPWWPGGSRNSLMGC